MLSRFGPRAHPSLRHAKPHSPSRRSKTAPPIRYPFGTSNSLRFCLVALWLIGAMVTAYWMVTRPVNSSSRWFAACCLLVGAGAALWGCVRTQTGLLRWDGAHWWVELSSDVTASPPRAVDRLDVQLDFQFFLLVRLDSSGGGIQWLWLDTWSQKHDWHALRRAVFSPKPATESPDSSVVSAEPAPATRGKA